MKVLKKLNRGMIIAVIAVIGVSIYLVGLGITQHAEIPAIKQVVESYINTYVGYNMLPVEYRIAAPNMPQATLDSYVAKMETDIKSYFVAGDNSYKFMTDTLKSDLQSQTSETTVVYNYTKEISKYTAFTFDKSTVTVTLDTNSSYDGPDKSNSVAVNFKGNAVTTDTVVLKKVDGAWKIVYSDITRPSQHDSFGGGMRRDFGEG
ncbi:MAG: hypothetical protein WCN92_13240 [Eubacteriales bacterium]